MKFCDKTGICLVFLAILEFALKQVRIKLDKISYNKDIVAESLEYECYITQKRE